MSNVVAFAPPTGTKRNLPAIRLAVDADARVFAGPDGQLALARHADAADLPAVRRQDDR
jgi:hypothetical protein